MNCLHIDPNLVVKKIEGKRRDYNYSCFDLLRDFAIPIEIYYHYFLSIEEFKLKNVWNHMIIRWNKMKRELSENEDFLQSEYFKDEYHQIHSNMNDEILNTLLHEFIINSHFKSLFVCNCIQNYIYPN